MKRQAIVSAIGLFLLVAPGAPAQAAHDQGPCIADHRLGPGPIVNGRHRQPTPREVELRLQRLKELSSGACPVNAAVASPSRAAFAGQQ